VATKRERQRRLARERHHRRLRRQAERERRAKQLSVAAIVAVLVVAVGVGSAFAAGVFKSTPKHPAASSTPSATPTPSASASSSTSALPAMVDGKCIYTSAGTAARKVKSPPAKPDTKASYEATLATNRGNIVIGLLNSKAPCTVNSFVSLADQDYFNNTHCQRLSTVDPYVLQCGDPTGTGGGGPGYEFANENTTGGFMSQLNSSGLVTYPVGTVAMANVSGQADSNGSQFFVVYKNSPLPPDYTPFGTIVSGLNIIQNVAKAGSDNSSGQGDGHPKEKVEINSVAIKKT
jgi:peptidyl-prolyl cis-trans isomerase B (cyclophilin B)